MSPRRIYVDIDDVLSATIESLIDLLEQQHARRVEVDEVLHFDLEKSFRLGPEQVRDFMEHAHSDEVIGSIAPKAGAADALEAWGSDGHDVRLVTGRPPTTNAASHRWLETHGLEFRSLHHLDKWNRPNWNRSGLPALRFEDLSEIGFDLAVEDSLETAVRLVEEFEIPVVLMDRPWNRDVGALSRKTRSGLIRCDGWAAVTRVSHEILGPSARRP